MAYTTTSFVIRDAKQRGLKVTEAKAPLMLEVYPTDLLKAKKRNSKHCAFACAAERAIPGVIAATFFRSTAWLEFNDRIERYRLPTSMQKEIVAFDRFGVMEPGTYRLSVPTESLKITREKARARVRGAARSTGKVPYIARPARRFQHKTVGLRTKMEPASS